MTLKSVEYTTMITWQEKGTARCEAIGPWIDILVEAAVERKDPLLQAASQQHLLVASSC